MGAFVIPSAVIVPIYCPQSRNCFLSPGTLSLKSEKSSLHLLKFPKPYKRSYCRRPVLQCKRKVEHKGTLNATAGRDFSYELHDSTFESESRSTEVGKLAGIQHRVRPALFSEVHGSDIPHASHNYVARTAARVKQQELATCPSQATLGSPAKKVPISNNIWHHLGLSVQPPAAQLNPGAGAAESLSRKSATWLLNIVAIGYAATAVAVKAMEDSASVSSASLEAAVSSPACAASVQFALRFCLAAALFAPSALFLQRGQRDAASLESTLGSATAPSSDGGEPGAARWHGVELGVWMFVTYAGQAVGLQTSSAHHAATLLSLSIVLVPLLEAAVGRAAAGPRSPSVWIATLLATAGMVLLEGGAGADAEALVSSSSCVWGWGAMAMPVGHVWCIVGAAASAIHVVRSEMLCGASRPLALISSQLATAAALSCGWVAWDVVAGGVDAASLWATAAAAAPFSSSAAASSSWLLLFLIGPVGTGLCEWLELEALRSVKASTATLILTAAPLWATLLAYLFLGESVDSSFAAGAVLILFACLEAQLLHGHGEEGEESPHATRDEAQGDSGLQLSSCQVAVEHRPRVAALLHAGSRMLQRSKGFGREAARGWSEDARAITALIRTSWSARHVARGLQPLAEENKLAESQHRAGGGLGSGREDGRFGGRLRKVPSALTQAFREVRNKGSDLQR